MSRSAFSRIPLAPIALLLSLALTFWGYRIARSYESTARQQRIERALDGVEVAISLRLARYAALVRACSALYMASETVTPQEFRHFLGSLDLDRNFPGVDAIGFVDRVRRADGSEAYMVASMEPTVGETTVIGTDLANEPKRRSAIERSRDTGEATITAKTALLADVEKRPGFVMFVPVYRAGAVLRTTENRREAVIGWIWARFHADEVMQTTRGPLSAGSDFAIYDGEEPKPSDLLYATRADSLSTFRLRRTVAFYGRPWTIEMSAEKAHAPADAQYESITILIAGTVASLLIAGIIAVLQSTRRRALGLAEQRSAELIESEARTRSIVQHMHTGLVTMDDQGLLTLVNPAAETIFHAPARELLGKPFATLLDEGDREFVVEALVERGSFRAKGRRKDGQPFPCEIAFFEFHATRGRELAASIRDLTAFEEVEQLKRNFVAIVSHELRTPLTSIRGALGLLAGGAAGDLTPDASRMVQIAERNSLRLMNLINDLLLFEKIEEGKLEMDIRPVAIATIIDRSLEAVREMANHHEVSLRVNGTEGDALADELRLTQVVVNLLSNAIKFSPRGAEVLVTTQPSDSSIEFRVIDHGRGIPAHALKRIFEPFEQADTSESRASGGTGLGLAISKAIIQRHGGTIGVQSEPARGSTFWFRVPAARALVVEPVGGGMS